MSDRKITLVDDGYVTVVVGQAEVRVDIFQAYNRIIQIGSEHKEATPYHDAIRQYMGQLGIPPGSDKLAVAFVDQICAIVNDLKKNAGDAGPPKSPASTTSTPSDSATPNTPPST